MSTIRQPNHGSSVPSQTPRPVPFQIDTNLESDQGHLKTAIRILPSWLVSMILHLSLIIGLALMSMVARSGQLNTLLVEVDDSGPAVNEAVQLDLSAVKLDLDSLMPEDEPELEPEENPLEVVELESLEEFETPQAIETSLVGTFSAVELSQIQKAIARRKAQQAKAAGSADGESRTGGANFLGLHAVGKRFVFIVDSSFSMNDKMEDCKRELESAIRNLDSDQQFYVIFFDHEAYPMRLGTWNEKKNRYDLDRKPAEDLVEATDQNVGALNEWLRRVKLHAWTNPFYAVEYTFNNLNPDAIFLLSDGEFNDRGMTEAFLHQRNLIESPKPAEPAIPIHTIGFYSRQGEVTLQRIANDHGGKYRFVPRSN